jgi:hypothetical protein
LFVDRIEEVSRPLREEVATIKLLLARVTGSLECGDLGASCESSKQESSIVATDDEFETASKVGDEAIADKTLEESSTVEEECIYGCFSPHARSFPSPQPDMSIASRCEAIDGTLVPVMLVMPELHELCREASSPLSMTHQVDSHETLVVAAAHPPVEPCQPLVFVDPGDKITKAGALAPEADALFAKELGDLLVSLEAASPGYGKEIACVLAGNASEDMIKKVEKSLSRVIVRRRRGFARKASATPL